MAQNISKNRKSEAQERFEQADNAGRFAGNDPDARAAREQAKEQIRQDTGSDSGERNRDDEFTDAEARRDPAQSQDYKGEAQNVNVDPEEEGRLGGNDRGADSARNKAMEGINQGRQKSDGSSSHSRGA